MEGIGGARCGAGRRIDLNLPSLIGPEPSIPPPPPPRPGRRLPRSVMSENLITMVFTDLVNSTAVKSELPGPDIRARNRAYLETILGPHRLRVEADLATHGGRVVKTE